MKILVLGAGGAAGINFCRSLKHAGGYHIIAADVDPVKVRMADADEYVVLPRVGDQWRLDRFGDTLCEFSPDVVYAQADKELAWLANDYIGWFESGGKREYVDKFLFKTLLPSRDALKIASDKFALCKCLFLAGIPVPLSSEWPCGLDERTYYNLWRGGKAWIRARVGAGSKAALPVTSYNQARNWVEYWCESRGLKPDDFMVSEYLPGKEYAWQGVYRDGQLYASVARTRDEYVFAEQMPSGQSSTPSVATIVHSDEVNSIAEAAVAAIDAKPNGVYGVDCKTAADGTVRVTEINVGRFYTTSFFYAAAGFNLPELYTRLAKGQELFGRINIGDFPIRDPIPAGFKWIRSLDREPLLVKPEPIKQTRPDQTPPTAYTLTGLGESSLAGVNL